MSVRFGDMRNSSYLCGVKVLSFGLDALPVHRRGTPSTEATTSKALGGVVLREPTHISALPKARLTPSSTETPMRTAKAKLVRVGQPNSHTLMVWENNSSGRGLGKLNYHQF